MGAGASPVSLVFQQRYPIMLNQRFLLNGNRNKDNNIVPFPSRSNTNYCYDSNSRRGVPPVPVVMTLMNEVTSDSAQISWQIVVGALAGVTPFVVAGIELGKRINAQRKCKTCRGSGLVLRDHKYYFRCPSCGGFLPWQSWTRFFTG